MHFQSFNDERLSRVTLYNVYNSTTFALEGPFQHNSGNVNVAVTACVVCLWKIPFKNLNNVTVHILPPAVAVLFRITGGLRLCSGGLNDGTVFRLVAARFDEN